MLLISFETMGCNEGFGEKNRRDSPTTTFNFLLN